MRLDHALKRVGATVVKTEKRADGGVALWIRVDEQFRSHWVDVYKDFLILAAGSKEWKVDFCKHFFVAENTKTLRYLWRVIFTGRVTAGSEALANAIIRVMAQKVDVKEFPLVGRANYQMDPSRGKLKGPHAAGAAEALVAESMRTK